MTVFVETSVLEEPDMNEDETFRASYQQLNTCEYSCHESKLSVVKIGSFPACGSYFNGSCQAFTENSYKIFLKIYEKF